MGHLARKQPLPLLYLGESLCPEIHRIRCTPNSEIQHEVSDNDVRVKVSVIFSVEQMHLFMEQY